MSARCKLTRRQLVYGAAGGLTALGAASLPFGLARAAVRGGSLVIATPADTEPASLDGQVDPYTSTFLFNSFVSDPLVVLTSERKFVPGIASGWTAAAEGREWIFTIRDGIAFQDGTPCDTEAVRFNIERVMNPDTHSALMATDLGQSVFLRAEVAGKNQVRLLYREPFPELLSGMSIFPIWSPAAVKQYGTSFQQHLVGEGAFRMTSWVRGDHITFTRNPAYRGGTTVQHHTGPAYLESITVKFVGSAGVLGEILKTGEANLVMGLPSQALPGYAHDPKYQVVTGYQPGNGMMFTMNTARATLNDVRVRQALRYACDQHRMNQTLYNETYVECYGPLTKYTLYYWKGADTAYRYDPAKARALLDAAGWKAGTSGIRERDGKPLNLTMVMLHHREIGEYLAAQFKSIGVDLRPVVVPGPVQLQRAQSGDFDLMYERLRTLEPDILYSEFYSKNEDKPGGWAWSRFHNPQLDAALLHTQQTADPQTRAKYFGEAQRLLTESAVYLPTLDDPQFFAMSSRVKGFDLGATGAWFFANDMYVE